MVPAEATCMTSCTSTSTSRYQRVSSGVARREQVVKEEEEEEEGERRQVSLVCCEQPVGQWGGECELGVVSVLT